MSSIAAISDIGIVSEIYLKRKLILQSLKKKLSNWLKVKLSFCKKYMGKSTYFDFVKLRDLCR